MVDRRDDKEKDALQKISDGIRYAPDAVFSFADDKSGANAGTKESTLLQDESEADALDNFQRSLQEYVDEKPKTVADGLFKGLLSVGNGIVQGVTGVVREPVKEVQKKGAIGIFTGVGKGVTGLVTKPLAGVFDMGVKTTQGVINTPGTIARSAVRLTASLDGSVPGPEFPIFGVKHEISLENAERHKIVHPTISIIAYIRKNGMDTQGIFRESGNVLQIKQICDNYDYGKEINFQDYDVKEISGVLKSYFRALPEPLLSYDLYNQFLNVMRSSTSPDKDALLYKALIKSLPAGDKLLLQSLLALLHDISKNSEVNKMSTNNLAIVFGPSLLRPRAENAASELFGISRRTVRRRPARAET